MIVERSCSRCGASIYDVVSPRPVGRPRRWCSPRCRRAASEERRAAANGAIATEYVRVEVSLDEHVRAVLDSPAACRRVLRDIRERAGAGLFQEARWGCVLTEVDRFIPQQGARLTWGRR